MNKRPRNTLGSTDFRKRKTGYREPRPRFLVVCEGEKTEPNYFKAFPVPSTDVVDVVGLGANTVSLVNEAERLKALKPYEQVWCVFDRDSFLPAQFNGAIQLAEQKGMRTAYSNEAFELWYLLHFDYHDAALSRSQYTEKLSQSLDVAYKKNLRDMYWRLADKQNTALKNAKRLLASYKKHNPANDNPSTTVHLLVEELNRYLR